MVKGLVTAVTVLIVVTVVLTVPVQFFQPAQSSEFKVPAKVQATLNLVIKDKWYNASAGMQPAFFVLKNGALYNSSSIYLPAGEMIRVNIVSYDEMNSTLFMQSYSNVSGTLDNKIVQDSGNSTLASDTQLMRDPAVSSVSPSSVTHTFSLEANGTLINVPVTMGLNTTAYFDIENPGVYSWACMCDCGPSMYASGWMFGTVYVS
ncbi:MAG: hypothetical protein M1151_07710 [Candidatus Thermoplasmatota archaeon]|jgi:heme/copper-type cytochrome/quinol oxidase subunit 2|nr:hypothetical protein [Candidatus Thermoplasmatota archaeon]MCL5786530.1 hypothetical protein [Candidatus Thermoplasmatota archaeon]